MSWWEANIPVRAPVFQRAHLEDCLEVWRQHVSATHTQALEPFEKLCLFNRAFVVDQGRWWKDGQRWVLEVSTLDGARFLDEDTLLHSDRGFAPGAQASAQAPQANQKTLRYHANAILSFAGLGLHFQRTSETLDEEAIVKLLWDYSCHPFVGKRIVADLLTHGERTSTVMPRLAVSVGILRELLLPLGVELSVTSPMPSRGTVDIPDEHQPIPPHLRRVPSR